jgi:3-oxoacyl-[acyl-carrier-protein] synthase II
VSTTHRRVVITGLGLVSPLGSSAAALWESLVAGRSAVAPITQFCATSLPTQVAAQATHFTGVIDDFGPLEKTLQRTIKKGLKVMCREIQMGVAAAQHALVSAQLDPAIRQPERTGVTFGSDYIITLPDDYVDAVKACTDEAGVFQFTRWAEHGIPQIDPLWLLKYLPNMPASHVAIYNDLRGPSNSITLREASANLTLGEAFSTIQRDSADVILAGATGTRVHSIRSLHVVMQEEFAGDAALDPTKLSRPFDRRRSGQVLGEGAAVLVLEERSAALARGVPLLGEILGHGSAVVHRGAQGPDLQAAITIAIEKSLASAQLTPAQIGHVHAHGLSTVAGDRAEAQAIQAVFGAHPVPVVAAKSNFGNLGAGGGLVELIASLTALQHGHLFPQLNYDEPDPACPVHICRSASTPAGDCFLNLNYTPQGQATAVVVGRP